MEEQATEKTYRIHLMVCAGTGCVSNHSFEIKDALEEEIKNRGIRLFKFIEQND